MLRPYTSPSTRPAVLSPYVPRCPPSTRAPDRSAGTAPRRRTARGPTLPHDRRSSGTTAAARSEEHTSELQSQSNLVCRLLLEKKKKKIKISITISQKKSHRPQ